MGAGREGACWGKVVSVARSRFELGRCDSCDVEPKSGRSRSETGRDARVPFSTSSTARFFTSALAFAAPEEAPPPKKEAMLFWPPDMARRETGSEIVVSPKTLFEICSLVQQKAFQKTEILQPLPSRSFLELV
jgi:hypothetical protein